MVEEEQCLSKMKNHKNLIFFALLIALAMIIPNVSALYTNQNTTVNATWGDTKTFSSLPDTNYGTANEMRVGESTDDQNSYILINVSAIESSNLRKIKNFSLATWTYAVPAGAGTIKYSLCNDYFNELTVTWNNQDTEVTNCNLIYSETVGNYTLNTWHFTNFSSVYDGYSSVKMNASTISTPLIMLTKEDTNISRHPYIIYFYDDGFYYNVSYNSSVLEYSNQIFSMNFNYNNSQVTNITANLTYNGTTYTTTGTKDSSTWNFTKTIITPQATNYTDTQNFYWTYYILYADGENTTRNFTDSQTVHVMNITKAASCTGNFPYAFYTGTFADELTSGALSSVTSVADFVLWNPDNPSYTRNYTLASSTNNVYCFHWATADYPFMAKATYSKISKANYTDRGNYMCKLIDNQSSQSQTQYLLSNTSDYQKFYFNIKNIQQQAIPNQIITFEKMSGTWNFLSSKMTDAYGNVVERLIPDEVYRITIYDENCTQTKQEILNLICSELPCTYDLTITNLTNPFETLEELPNFAYSWDFDKTTKILTLGYDDQGNQSDQVILTLYNKSINGDDTLICTNSSVLSTDSLTCNLTNYSSGTFIAYMNVDPANTSIILTRWYNFGINQAKQIFGNETLIWSALIIITLFFVGIWNPVVAVTLAFVGVIITALVGFMALQWVAFILIAVVFIIIIIKLKS